MRINGLRLVCVLIFTALFSSLALISLLLLLLLCISLVDSICILSWLYIMFHACVFCLFVLSLGRDLNKNSSDPCSYLRRVLEDFVPFIRQACVLYKSYFDLRVI